MRQGSKIVLVLIHKLVAAGAARGFVRWWRANLVVIFVAKEAGTRGQSSFMMTGRATKGASTELDYDGHQSWCSHRER